MRASTRSLIATVTTATVVQLICVPAKSASLVPDSTVCYVWDFSTDAGGHNDLTRSLTDYFEEALTQLRFFTVLQRREFAGLFVQRQNEDGVMRIQGVPDSSRRVLLARSANAVAFGVVKDRSGSEIGIRVRMEGFDGKVIDVHSILIRRGVIGDATTQRDSMASLARQFDPRHPPPPPKRRHPLRVGVVGSGGESRLHDSNFTDARGTYGIGGFIQWMKSGAVGVEAAVTLEHRAASGAYVSMATGAPTGETYHLDLQYGQALVVLVRDGLRLRSSTLALYGGPYVAIPLDARLHIASTSGPGWEESVPQSYDFGFIGGVELTLGRIAWLPSLSIEGLLGTRDVGTPTSDPRTAVLRGSAIGYRVALSHTLWATHDASD